MGIGMMDAWRLHMNVRKLMPENSFFKSFRLIIDGRWRGTEWSPS